MAKKKTTQEKDDNNDEKTQQQLSVIATSGLAATASSSSVSMAATDPVSGGASGKNRGTTAANIPSSSSSSSSAPSNGGGILDFITTGPAVKSLFSIPFSEAIGSTSDAASTKPRSVCLAIHNFDGTLIIDHAEDEENYFHKESKDNEGTTTATVSHLTPPSNNPTKLLPQSAESLALALSPRDSHVSSEALSLLSDIVNASSSETMHDSQTNNHNHHHPNHHLLAPPMAPREYVEWNFQDMNLLVGSDALIVRPGSTPQQPTGGDPSATAASGGFAGVAVRVEEMNNLRSAWHSFQQKQQLLLQSQPSYAQALSSSSSSSQQQTTKTIEASGVSKVGSIEQDQKGRFPVVPLQTCIMPSSGPFGGQFLIESSSKLRSSGEAVVAPSASVADDTANPSPAPPSTAPALSIVLDAYLDNLMANVPQLALCLQEKGLVQSIKFLQTEDIPSMMVHPSTLGMGAAADDFSRTKRMPKSSSNPVDDMFSPQIMEMNASALLRFLKANCTRNNTTYLLRHEPPGVDGTGSKQQNIQLYDISSLSTQGQKKWIWWLATMSHRFALRLRHLEVASTTTSSLSESQKRTIRDRERSLFQQTLDLLQDLMDMDGSAHETFVASVREHLADTYLGTGATIGHVNDAVRPSQTKSASCATDLPTSIAAESHSGSFHVIGSVGSGAGHEHAHENISVDALNKAQDHLVLGIKLLSPIFETIKGKSFDVETQENSPIRRRRQRPGEAESEATNEEQVTQASVELSPATVLQVFGMNHKLVHVSLRLADHHLKNYYSSSAMQALRASGRRLAEAAALMNYYREHIPSTSTTQRDLQEKERSLLLQYVLLLQYCGYFARSFAFDEKWRDQGHASGEDVVSVLKDVEAALCCENSRSASGVFGKIVESDDLQRMAYGTASLRALSGVVVTTEVDQIQKTKLLIGSEEILEKEMVLQRERRRVLVASCVCYSRALTAFKVLMTQVLHIRTKDLNADQRPLMLDMLQKWLGDACNETGRTLLQSLQRYLQEHRGKKDSDFRRISERILCSAKFWFSVGLEAFGACGDLTNLVLVRCNLGSSYKIEANDFFSDGDSGPKHAESCLQKAADELTKAHESLGRRDEDPRRWDVVSEDLANVLIVLGTRRRRTLLGDQDTSVVLPSERLSPGEESSITDPLERALKIYEQSGNESQRAATHYQLAQTFFRLFTSQRDENSTRKKLGMAVEHYRSAHMYYSSHLQGHEVTFCLICLDMASIYATVPGEYGLKMGVGCCLDSRQAFSLDSIKAALQLPTVAARNEWLDKMTDVSQSIEKRIFELTRDLAKVNQSRYRALYKEGLSAKFSGNINQNEELCEGSPQVGPMLTLHAVLMAVKHEYDKVREK